MPTILIDREELQRRVKNGAQLIEVLPAKEFERAHLPSAISIPLAKLSEKSTEFLDKKKDTIVYCYDYQ